MNTEATTITSRAVRLLQSQSPLVVFLVLCAVGTICFPTFLTPLNFSNIFRQVSLYGIISIGMTLVIISGGIDLSVGATAALAAILTARLSTNLGGEYSLLVVLLPLLAGVCIGAGNAFLVARVKIPPFIATLAMMLGIRGLAFVVSGKVSVSSNASPWLVCVAEENVVGIPCIGILFVLALGVGVLVANYTSFGRSLFAIGGNEEAARMMGVSVNRSKMLAYMACGGCAAVAGVLHSLRLGFQPSFGSGWELTAIAAVVIGGTSLMGGIGKMSHTFYGVLILGTISNIIKQDGRLLESDTNLITGALLLAVILLQSKLTNQTHSVGDKS